MGLEAIELKAKSYLHKKTFWLYAFGFLTLC